MTKKNFEQVIKNYMKLLHKNKVIIDIKTWYDVRPLLEGYNASVIVIDNHVAHRYFVYEDTRRPWNIDVHYKGVMD